MTQAPRPLRGMTRGRRRGFTLLEILLASALLSGVLISVQTLLVQSRKVARAAGMGLAHEREVGLLLARLRAALVGMSPYLQRDEDADMRGDGQDLRFTTEGWDPGRAGAQALAEEGFLRADPELDPDERPPDLSTARMATLHLGQDDEGVFVEVFPTGWLRRDPAGDPARWVERLERVREFELEYYDGREWKDEWSLRRSLRLPRALRLTLTLARPTPGGAVEEVAELVVPLASTRDVSIK